MKIHLQANEGVVCNRNATINQSLVGAWIFSGLIDDTTCLSCLRKEVLLQRERSLIALRYRDNALIRLRTLADAE